MWECTDRTHNGVGNNTSQEVLGWESNSQPSSYEANGATEMSPKSRINEWHITLLLLIKMVLNLFHYLKPHPKGPHSWNTEVCMSCFGTLIMSSKSHHHMKSSQYNQEVWGFSHAELLHTDSEWGGMEAYVQYIVMVYSFLSIWHVWPWPDQLFPCVNYILGKLMSVHPSRSL